MLPWVTRLTDGGTAALPYYSDDLLGAAGPELAEALPLRPPAPAAVLDLATAGPRCPFLPGELPDCHEPAPVGGLPALKLAVADHLRSGSGLTVQPSSEVLITAGVSGALVLALGALVNRGDRVVLFDPTSPLYRLTARHRHARVRWVRTWVGDGITRFDPLQLVDALRGARLIVVNAPANPTGAVFAPEALEQIAWWADRRDVLIFNDEVFAQFAPDGRAASIATQPRAVDRTLTAGSVSKGHGLPGLRVGWLAGHRQLIRPCLLSAALQWSSVPTICQEITLAALRQDADAFARMHDPLPARRRLVTERLQALELDAQNAPGYYFWLNVAGLGIDGAAFAERLLQAHKVLVWPGHHFGPASRGHVRISCAADEATLRKGLARLGACVRQLRAIGPAEVARRAA